jgi:hypothetical protein
MSKRTFIVCTDNAEARVHGQVNSCGIMLEKAALGQFFTRVLRIFPVSIILSRLLKLIYHLGMNNRPAAGRSSETHQHEYENVD